MARRETRDVLARLAGGEQEAVNRMVGMREEHPVPSDLPASTVALAKIAALIAVDAPPASYGRQVTAAIEAGASSDDILAILRAVAPQVGSPKVVAAAAELMLALGMTLPDGGENG